MRRGRQVVRAGRPDARPRVRRPRDGRRRRPELHRAVPRAGRQGRRRHQPRSRPADRTRRHRGVQPPGRTTARSRRRTTRSPRPTSKAVEGLRLVGALNGFPWWADAAAGADRTATSTSSTATATTSATPSATTTWSALELFRKAMGDNGPAADAEVTTADVIGVYQGISGETLDGLLPAPVTLRRPTASSPLSRCFWLFDMQDGASRRSPSAIPATAPTGRPRRPPASADLLTFWSLVAGPVSPPGGTGPAASGLRRSFAAGVVGLLGSAMAAHPVVQPCGGVCRRPGVQAAWVRVGGAVPGGGGGGAISVPSGW